MRRQQHFVQPNLNSAIDDSKSYGWKFAPVAGLTHGLGVQAISEWFKWIQKRPFTD